MRPPSIFDDVELNRNKKYRLILIIIFLGFYQKIYFVVVVVVVVSLSLYFILNKPSQYQITVFSSRLFE